MKSIFFLIILIYSVLVNKLSFAHELNERFIVMGHLYPILNDQSKYKRLVDKVNSYNPDYIFILGDSELQNEEIYKKYLDSFKAEIFFSPGNHELKKSKEGYIKNVGYLDLVIEKKFSRYILINSSDEVNNIKKNLTKFLSKEFEDGPTILLTHHRIWDDTLISKKPYQHDKHFYFEEIYPIIKDKVEYIFSGNSKRQYFMDLENIESYGKQNVNNINWLDKIGSINAYSIGMGDGSPKASFTIVDIFNDQLNVKGDFSTNENYDILPKELIVSHKNRLSKKYNKKDYFFINKEKLYLFFFAIALILLIIFFLKKKTFSKK